MALVIILRDHTPQPPWSTAGYWSRIVRPIFESQIQEQQCGVQSGLGTLVQLSTSHLWEFAPPVHTCFVALEKPFDRFRGTSCGGFPERPPTKGCSVPVWPEEESVLSIASSKSDISPVQVGLCECCPFSLWCYFINTMYRASDYNIGKVTPEGWFSCD